MLLYFIFFYYFLAKIFPTKLKIHSIIHCVSATIFNSIALFYINNINILTLNFCSYNLNANENIWFQIFVTIATYNSFGYFIADSLDIISDWNNVKRRVFLIHHIFAILGLFVSLSGSVLTNYAIWSLEIGGIVHHLKHASEIYNFPYFYYLIAQILYLIVYLTSRILLLINSTNCLLYNYTTIYEKFGIFISYCLLIQNMTWFFVNLKNLKLSNKTSYSSIKQITMSE